jgi:hypothetical protein
LSKVLILCGTVTVLVSALAYRPASADPLSPLLACRNVSDPTARLACFDRESAALAPLPAAAQGTPAAAPAPAAVPAPAPQVAQAPAPAAAGTPAPAAPVSAAPAPAAVPPRVASAANAPENFGLAPGVVTAKEVAAGSRPPDLDKINAHITALALSNSGRATFTLDNGQVWRQLSSEGDLLAKPGDEVTISKGLLRSYWLQASSGRGCKVTRVL